MNEIERAEVDYEIKKARVHLLWELVNKSKKNGELYHTDLANLYTEEVNGLYAKLTKVETLKSLDEVGKKDTNMSDLPQQKEAKTPKKKEGIISEKKAKQLEGAVDYVIDFMK